MLRVFEVRDGRLREVPVGDGAPMPAAALWIDMLAPTAEEEAGVERALGIDIPTRAEAGEIQTSSRLRAVDGTLYMSALVPPYDAARSGSAPITFVRRGATLVTVREGSPKAVEALLARCEAGEIEVADGDDVLFVLLDAIVDRISDRLETIGNELERIEAMIFRRGTTRSRVGRRLGLGRRIRELQDAIESLGALHRNTVVLRESLQSLIRLVAFRRAHAPRGAEPPLLPVVEADLKAIADHLVELRANMEFILEATVGLIDVQQNKVIYILSIVGVVLTPPVLVASVYGMNFQRMPELEWAYGYPWALGLMAASAVLPYLFVKLKGWL